jgi:hypothetical protein
VLGIEIASFFEMQKKNKKPDPGHFKKEISKKRG